MSNHRWTWPEEATALTDWMGSKALVKLTGSSNANKGANSGRVLDYMDERGERHVALVERRATVESERGKYRYRLLDAALLESYYEAIDYEAFALSEPKVGLFLQVNHPDWASMPVLVARTTYHADLPALFKQYGGTWNKEYYQWEFHNETLFEDVHRELVAFYGLGDGGRTFTVRVHIDAVIGTLLRYKHATLFERQVLKRSDRWSVFRMGMNVTMSHPEDPEHCTLVIRDVPPSVYERGAKGLGDHIVEVRTYQEGEEPGEEEVRKFDKKAWGKALEARSLAMMNVW